MWFAIYLGLTVHFYLPADCLDLSPSVVGCAEVGGKEVWIKPGMSPMAQEHVIFHEAYHARFDDNELKAEEFAQAYTGGRIIDYWEYFPELVINLDATKL